MIAFRVNGTPAPKGSFRIFTRGKGGVPLANPIVRKDSDATYTWEQVVGWAARRAMGPTLPLGGAMVLTVTFFLERPASVTRKYPEVKPDADKLARSTQDALEKIVFKQDSQVVDLVVRKRYADGVAPGALIQVEPLA